jgi:Metallo-beta-lactamase superfamily
MGYEKGLREVADGVWAYLQPDGGWGWSIAGLIAGEGRSLLVDTLFDLRLTAEMLDAMRPITAPGHPIDTVVNTHSDAGMTPLQAARDIHFGSYADWWESERVVANVHALYRDFGGNGPEGLDVLRDMATLAEQD